MLFRRTNPTKAAPRALQRINSYTVEMYFPFLHVA